MSVFVAVSKFEFESLSFTEQNKVNESDEPSQSSLHFGRNSISNFVSLFPCSGEDLLVHLYCCNGNTGNMNTHYLWLHFYIQLKNEDTEDGLQKQTRVALVLRSQHDNSTTVNVCWRSVFFVVEHFFLNYFCIWHISVQPTLLPSILLCFHYCFKLNIFESKST